jgi:hypothetical protein
LAGRGGITCVAQPDAAASPTAAHPAASPCRCACGYRVHNRYSHATDRGCTKSGCDAPAYHSRVHQVRGWTKTRRTDIHDLTLACGAHNRLAEKCWTTRTNTKGDTEWLPPPHLDYWQPRVDTYPPGETPSARRRRTRLTPLLHMRGFAGTSRCYNASYGKHWARQPRLRPETGRSPPLGCECPPDSR